MKWDDFIRITGRMAVIESESLFAGRKDMAAVQVQLSRWHTAGKLIQLKRGVYVLNEHYRKVELNELFLASFLERPSYVSMEKALEFHGLIPESVPLYTCVTTRRPYELSSAIGRFSYRHIKHSLFWGYNSFEVNKQIAFIALPEKALLDMVYLNRQGVSEGYIAELRLQNTDKINMSVLMDFGRRFEMPAVLRAAGMIKRHILEYRKGDRDL